MNEVWKDIEGYEGLYQVSNLGRVKSLKFGKEKILSPGKYSKFGHLQVQLYKNGEIKNISVHRLVGKAFVTGWFEGAVINHKDHNPLNNVSTNLEWTTAQDNNSRVKSFAGEINKKFKSKKVSQYSLDGTFIREWSSASEIERQLGFNQSHICACCNGKRKSAHKYIWRYA